MKHLKLFEDFDDMVNYLSNGVEIRNYLKDIFLELQDDGFVINISLNQISQTSHYFRIDIHKTDYPVSWSPKESDRFILKDIWPTLQTTNTYMTEEGYKLILLSGVVPDKRGGRSDHRGYPTHYSNFDFMDISIDDIDKLPFLIQSKIAFINDPLFSIRIEFKKEQ
jgi:hypothetical protein